MSIGNRIKEEREALDWSQKDLAQKSGVKQQMISKLERGKAKGTTGIVPLSIALNVTAEWLHDGKGIKERGAAIQAEIESYPESVQAEIAAAIHRRLAAIC